MPLTQATLDEMWLKLGTYVVESAELVGLFAVQLNHPFPPSWEITRNGQPADPNDVANWLGVASLHLYQHATPGHTVVTVVQPRASNDEAIAAGMDAAQAVRKSAAETAKDDHINGWPPA